MKTIRFALLCFVTAAATFSLTSPALATVTNVAWYRFGENDPGAVSGGTITTAVDCIALQNLTFHSSAKYINSVSPSAFAATGSTLAGFITNNAYGICPIVTQTNNNFGIEAWVKPSAFGTTGQVIAYNGSTATSGFGLIIGTNAAGSNEFLGLYGGQTIIDGGPATAGVWTHVALVCLEGVTTIYTNGVASVSTAAAPAVPAGNFAVGAPPQSPSSQFYFGSVDEVRVFTFDPTKFSTNDLLINQSPAAVPQIVTTLADNGNGSLRSTVSNAPSGASITFLTNGVITLTSGSIPVTNTVTIDASALPQMIQINGNSNSCVFTVTNSVTAVFNSLIITNGHDTNELAGGIYNQGTLNLNNCIVTGNSDTVLAGGIANINGSLTLSNCIVSGNSSASSGGGLENFAGTVAIWDSSFVSNLVTAGYGGGIHDEGSGTVYLYNSTMALNVATNDEFGGGIDINSGTVVFNDCTVSSNTAGQGGGINVEAGATLSLSDTIVAGNTASTSNNVSGSFNGGGNFVSGNPLLAPLGFYGGTTPTMPPLSGSPCIDAGLDEATNFLATDQRGFPRLSGAHVDIGAVESEDSLVVSSTADSGAGSLRNAITAIGSGGIITFAPSLAGQTVSVTNGQIAVNNNVTIDGSTLSSGVTLSGQHVSRIFIINSGANCTINDLTFTEANGGGADGGAIFNNGIATLNNCTLATNATGSGGAIENFTSAVMTLNNCTLTANSSAPAGGGGAIVNKAVLSLINCTFATNTSFNGASIYNDTTGVLHLTNTILADTTTSIENLHTTNGINYLVDVTNANLAPLGDYGGLTQTMPPLSGSAAIDAGLDSVTNFLTTDQRGYPRLAGAHVDIGAVEVQTNLVVSTTAESGVDSLPAALAAIESGGVVTISPSLSGRAIVLTSGPITVNNSVTIDGSALARPLRLDGDAQSTVFIVNPGVTATLNSLIITNGVDNTGSLAGGIVNNGSLTINDCTFAGNAENIIDGGGGGLQNNGGALVVNNSIFSNNISMAADGGGGGAIQTIGGTVTLNQCIFSGNSAIGGGSWGGAIYNNSSMTLTNCTVSGNSTGDRGAGIFSAGDGTSLVLNNCTVSGNVATNSGGDPDGGGGIFNFFSPLTLNNCTIANNSTTNGDGGGIYNGGGATLIVNNCTIAGNSVTTGTGGGVLITNSASIYLTNTIVAGNTASSSNNVAGAFTGTDNLTSGNPLLLPLGNYGGPTETMPPMAGSPVIDAGDDEVTNFLATDQRGYPRLSGAHVDIGAVEAQIPTLTITSPAAGETFSNLTITASGTANGLDAVAAVYVMDSGGTLTPATTTDNWTNWTAMVTLTPLANTLSAYAVSSNGIPSLTNSVNFTFASTNFTTVTNRNKPADVLTILINDLGPAKTPNRVTPLKDGALVAVSNKVTLTAVPGHNWIFSNWVFGASQPYSETNSPTLKFVMESNFIAEANFVTNVFLPMQGTYYGLFAPTNGSRSQTNSGALTFSVTHTGSLSGKVTLGSVSAPLSGSFDAGGLATVPTKLKGSPATTTTLQLDFVNQLATGSVSNADFDSPLLANLNVFSALNKATKFVGQYTLIIPGTTNSAVGPLGTSYGTVKISTTGAVTLTGALADGTPVTASSGIGKDGLWPLYLPLYKGNGSFWSWNLFDSNGVVSSSQIPVTNASPSWISGGNSAHNALYAAGFTNTNAVIYGSTYSSADHPLLTDLAGKPVVIEGGNLTSAQTNTLADSGAVDASNIVLTLNKTTGAVSGQFLDGTKKIKVNGVLLQIQTNVAGFFLGTSQSGLFQLNP